MIEFNKLVALSAALNREGVDYMLFGGAAVNLHGLRRATEDFDFFVSPEPANVQKIKRALRSLWNDPSLDEIQDDDMIGDYPSFSYAPPGEGFGLDFVSRLGEAFRYNDLEAEIHYVSGVPIRIATPRTLYRMKRNTVRPMDRHDAERLREKFNLSEE
ncbi:MAG TPA: hypothetical protein VGR02_04295 [Thermoanaerobaculia bacterium]|jgi:hypothetical protein|nr:hypothetical protein [Thermoanaerobaculia bacterium]